MICQQQHLLQSSASFYPIEPLCRRKPLQGSRSFLNVCQRFFLWPPGLRFQVERGSQVRTLRDIVPAGRRSVCPKNFSRCCFMITERGAFWAQRFRTSAFEIWNHRPTRSMCLMQRSSNISSERVSSVLKGQVSQAYSRIVWTVAL
jgi:hypothetical protein